MGGNPTTHEKIVNAELRAAEWLAKANERREAGKSDEREIEKSTYWLARANRLRGWA